jgi:hypothetical protein
VRVQAKSHQDLNTPTQVHEQVTCYQANADQIRAGHQCRGCQDGRP